MNEDLTYTIMVIVMAAVFSWFAIGCMMLEVHILKKKVKKIEDLIKELNPGADL